MSEGIVAAGYCLFAIVFFVWEGGKYCVQKIFRCCRCPAGVQSENNPSRNVIAANPPT
jgi:hypothetical protein